MSLRITTKTTEKQKSLLRQLEYSGTGEYRIENISRDEASLLINELFEEQRLIRIMDEEDKYKWV